MLHPTNNKDLRGKILWHLKVVAGALFITLIFSLTLRRQLIHEAFPGMLLLTFVQLEVFIWLGTLFFQSIQIEDPKYLQKSIVRLIVFYLTVLLIAFLMLLGLYTYQFIRDGADFAVFFSTLSNLELKGFFIATIVGFAFGAVFFFYTQWAEALKRMQKLKEEKLIFQYETLKNQVNPHFLFNSLNTLSSLLTQDAELSEKFIQKLSSVYRYVLENREKELVSLADELEFVKDFFYLQKIRDGEKIELKIEVKEKDEISILPVSLQMLVENAIKHNVASKAEPLEITVHFEGIDKLVVRNHLQKRMQLNHSSQIGLKNLNERCRLILKREIETQETNDEFVVKVPVKIK